MLNGLLRTVLLQSNDTDGKRTLRGVAFMGLNPPDIKNSKFWNTKPPKNWSGKFISSYAQNSLDWTVKFFFLSNPIKNGGYSIFLYSFLLYLSTAWWIKLIIAKCIGERLQAKQQRLSSENFFCSIAIMAIIVNTAL